MPLLLLSVLFGLTAFLYAAVGFGGGSTYTALLVLSDIDYRLIPPLSLLCNIIVVTGGTVQAVRAGHLNPHTALPFAITSVPLAFMGGMIALPEKVFIGLLAAALLLAGMRLLITQPNNDYVPAPLTPIRLGQSMIVGAALGFLSGLVGIGGGIFLAPVLYFMHWDTPKRIAAICTLFILVNSLSGLAGQLLKVQKLHLTPALIDHWPLAVAVFIGGAAGSYLGFHRMPMTTIRRLTALLVLAVAIRLLFRFFSLQ